MCRHHPGTAHTVDPKAWYLAHDDEDHVVCHVCKSNEQSHANQLVWCDWCHQCVHQQCHAPRLNDLQAVPAVWGCGWCASASWPGRLNATLHNCRAYMVGAEGKETCSLCMKRVNGEEDADDEDLRRSGECVASGPPIDDRVAYHPDEGPESRFELTTSQSNEMMQQEIRAQDAGERRNQL